MKEQSLSSNSEGDSVAGLSLCKADGRVALSHPLHCTGTGDFMASVLDHLTNLAENEWKYLYMCICLLARLIFSQIRELIHLTRSTEYWYS